MLAKSNICTIRCKNTHSCIHDYFQSIPFFSVCMFITVLMLPMEDDLALTVASLPMQSACARPVKHFVTLQKEAALYIFIDIYVDISIWP